MSADPSALTHWAVAVVFTAQPTKHPFDEMCADTVVVDNAAVADGALDSMGKITIGSVGGGSHDLHEVNEERSDIAFVVPLPKVGN